eukprot:GHVR01173189.1.p1 GENE.GHVR01173189.1~~GHVR01173189.1.p1  ORF type:complete len:167 (-),score=58.78 GHVR01173189.1:799-1299(-)
MYHILKYKQIHLFFCPVSFPNVCGASIDTHDTCVSCDMINNENESHTHIHTQTNSSAVNPFSVETQTNVVRVDRREVQTITTLNCHMDKNTNTHTQSPHVCVCVECAEVLQHTEELNEKINHMKRLIQEAESQRDILAGENNPTVIKLKSRLKETMYTQTHTYIYI